MITYPRQRKRKIITIDDSNIYAVAVAFNSGKFGFADFWDLPYTSRSYAEAVHMKKKIIKKATQYKIWTKERFIIAKINLD